MLGNQMQDSIPLPVLRKFREAKEKQAYGINVAAAWLSYQFTMNNEY